MRSQIRSVCTRVWAVTNCPRSSPPRTLHTPCVSLSQELKGRVQGDSWVSCFLDEGLTRPETVTSSFSALYSQARIGADAVENCFDVAGNG